jgi:hypothetical protein
MATSNSGQSKPRKRASSASSKSSTSKAKTAAKTKATPKAKAAKPKAPAKTKTTAKSKPAAKKTAAARSKPKNTVKPRPAKRTSSPVSKGLVDQAVDAAKQTAGTAKQVAGKATGPAVAVGAAAVGVAGGLALKGRRAKASDVEGIVKTIGKASKRLAATSKNVSKDIERAGDKAERIGKILD